MAVNLGAGVSGALAALADEGEATTAMTWDDQVQAVVNAAMGSSNPFGTAAVLPLGGPGGLLTVGADGRIEPSALPVGAVGGRSVVVRTERTGTGSRVMDATLSGGLVGEEIRLTLTLAMGEPPQAG